MPAAALVKGILLSLGVLAALGFAAYENPEVQQWIDEQRRRLADLLRGIGEELDPQSRREAEAFAYHGRTPTAQPDQPRPTAETTGADLTNSTIRRVPIQGRLSEADTEERQRLGREYLAARNQLLRVMRQRRDVAEQSTTLAGQTESGVDIKAEQNVKEEWSDAPESSRGEAPPLPPKVKLEEVEPIPWSDTSPQPDLPAMPGSFEQPPPEMTYDEQIAHAISLSQQENNADRSAADAYDDDVKRAVEASLRDFSNHVSYQVGEPQLNATSIDLLGDDLPRPNVWSQEDDLYTVTPNLTKASLAAWNQQLPQHASQNPFEDSNATSWTFDGDESKTAEAGPSAVQADDSDDESGIVVTPDSWTEVGSLPGDVEHEHQPA